MMEQVEVLILSKKKKKDFGAKNQEESLNIFGVKSILRNVLSDSVDVSECYILDDFVHSLLY